MRLLCLLCLALSLSGCGGEDISVYRVPKEISGAKASPEAAAQSPGGIAWDVPKGWALKPGSEMRVASFSAGGKSGRPAEVSVVRLPGEAGGVLANVNRWRGQVGLGPLDEKGLASELRRLETGAGEVLMVDARGRGSRMLAAMLSLEGDTWFFKMTGEGSAVEAARPSFEAFLRSLRREKP